MALPSTPNLSQLPDRWQHGTDETQRSWLQAKSDEERRRQEEERTKQESFRLEIRRTELEMLREAFRGGMPPHLVPVIFTGGGALAGTSAEWANHYIAQLNQSQQQLLQGNVVSPPDSRIESRMITATEHQTPKSGALSSVSQTPGQATAVQSHLSSASSHAASALHHPSSAAYSPFSTSGMSPARNQAQQIHSSEPPRSSLPRINTNEMHIQPPPQGPPPGMGMQLSGVPPRTQAGVSHLPPHQPHQQHPTPPHPEPRQPEASPIFFHHWQPPSTQSAPSATMASTSPASGKNADSSPYSNQPYASGNEASHSPKKRKIVSGGHHSQPPANAGQPSVQANPSFSPGSSINANKRRGVNTTHNRHRSDSGSTRGYEPYPKNPASRPRRSEAGDGNGTTGQFSISHMTTSHEESPEMIHREPPKPQSNIGQESPSSHHRFQAGPESRHDLHIHRERENSIGQGPPLTRN
ncbi:hypothetical protein ABW19_dt0207111 [Dactylella cylindrospora]|nr:hypothetical protein ABW19_dt0207111 [Dactylella cylindrospora]